MSLRIRFALIVLSCIVLTCSSVSFGQQKAQWVPGQVGLNAGLMPEPGFTFNNITVNYSAGSLNDANGNRVPGLTGNYSFWVTENVLYYVPNFKILGARIGIAGIFPAANGSLTAPTFGFTGGGYGYADMFVRPLALGWHFDRLDTYVGYGFTAPTGRYVPGASDNIGSGYWGHNVLTGTTLYLTKNKTTTLNLTTSWEIHGQKKGSNITPGQAFTTEWGLGQLIPLDKQFQKLLQIGVIGYDQWQVSDNGGTLSIGVPASTLPRYSVHGIGFQTTFLVPKRNLNIFFKYIPEYSATAHTLGRTIVFGGAYTFRIPKQ